MATALRAKSATGLALSTTGQVKMTGIGEGTGKVLTSDASGNTSWQAAPGSNMLAFKHTTQAWNIVSNWFEITYSSPILKTFHQCWPILLSM